MMVARNHKQNGGSNSHRIQVRYCFSSVMVAILSTYTDCELKFVFDLNVPLCVILQSIFPS